MKVNHVKTQQIDWAWTIVIWLGGSLFLSVFLYLDIAVMMAGADMVNAHPSVIYADILALILVGFGLFIYGGINKDVIEHKEVVP